MYTSQASSRENVLKRSLVLNRAAYYALLMIRGDDEAQFMQRADAIFNTFDREEIMAPRGERLVWKEVGEVDVDDLDATKCPTFTPCSFTPHQYYHEKVKLLFQKKCRAHMCPFFLK